MKDIIEKISKHINNLQWELDRMSEDGRTEYNELIKIWKKYVKKRS